MCIGDREDDYSHIIDMGTKLHAQHHVDGKNRSKSVHSQNPHESVVIPVHELVLL